VIAAVGIDVPHLLGFVPDGGGDGGLENGELVEVVLPGDGLAVREDFGAAGVMVLGHIVEFVEEGEVVIGDDVAGHSGIAVPVPGTANVRCPLDDANALDADLAQSRGGQEGGEAAADKEALDGIVERLTRRDGFRVGIDFILRQVAGQVVGILRETVWPVVQPEVAFLGKLALDAIVELLRPRGLCG